MDETKPKKRIGRPPGVPNGAGKARDAIAWLKANPDKSLREAAAQFDITHIAIIRAMNRIRGGAARYCPICQQKLHTKGALRAAGKFIKANGIK